MLLLSNNNEVKMNLEGLIQNDTLITGGHFLINENGSANLNKGTIESFRLAVNIYKRTKSVYDNVGLGILINDMGGICSSLNCTIGRFKVQKTEMIPVAYTNILEEYGINFEELNIFWEKHMRNRGKKLLKKHLKQQEKRLMNHNGDYWFEDDQDMVLLTHRNLKDKYGTPACPLIMVAYAGEQNKRGFTSSVNIYYKGEHNDNIPNYSIIEAGKIIAKKLGIDMNIENIGIAG